MRLIAPPFQVLPSKEEFPDYYEMVKYPIDLNTIHQRIQSNKYARLDNLLYDLRLLCQNAEMYNEPGSLIRKDCEQIRRLIARFSREFSGTTSQGSDASRPQNDMASGQPNAVLVGAKAGGLPFVEHPVDRNSPLQSRCLHICEYLCTLRSTENNRLADTLFRLPARQLLPEYYSLIAVPSDLATVLVRAGSDLYKTPKEFVRDMVLTFENCILFLGDRPGSADYYALYQVRASVLLCRCEMIVDVSCLC